MTATKHTTKFCVCGLCIYVTYITRTLCQSSAVAHRKMHTNWHDVSISKRALRFYAIQIAEIEIYSNESLNGNSYIFEEGLPTKWINFIENFQFRIGDKIGNFKRMCTWSTNYYNACSSSCGYSIVISASVGVCAASVNSLELLAVADAAIAIFQVETAATKVKLFYDTTLLITFVRYSH